MKVDAVSSKSDWCFQRTSGHARARVSSLTTAVNTCGLNAQSSRTDMGSDSTHCRTFAAGNTRSTRCAAVPAGVAHEPTETMPQQPALQISLQRPLHERGHGAALCLSLLQKPGQPGGQCLGERRLFRTTAFALARRRAGRMSAVHIGSSDTDPACRRAARTSQATTLQAGPAQQHQRGARHLGRGCSPARRPARGRPDRPAERRRVRARHGLGPLHAGRRARDAHLVTPTNLAPSWLRAAPVGSIATRPRAPCGSPTRPRA